MKKCFDSEKYLKIQKAKILDRIKRFPKLYLEFGGKLADDNHAARVLPGFSPDLKIRLLQELKDEAEILIPINANDIEKNRIRADRMITYEMEVFRLIEFFRSRGLLVKNVVITLYTGQKKVEEFAEKLRMYDVEVWYHAPTLGYPTDVKTIVSDAGYGANPYIQTERPIVVVTAPGPGSGKLATCLSQLYHEGKQGVKAGYAKFETFPVWNLPLKHPVNIAYEAATADIDDINMIDSYHLEKYGVVAINYNRDIELFPVLREILRNIYGEDVYFSPTDMGVNVIGECIIDNALAEKAAKEEIIRRYLRAISDVKRGRATAEVAETILLLMNELEIGVEDRKVVVKAEKKKQKCGTSAACMEVGGRYVVGRKTGCLSPVASVMLNTLKVVTKIPDEVDLISNMVLEPMLDMKNQTSNFRESYLKLPEVMMALAVSSATNPMVQSALSALDRLKGAEFHATYLVPDDEMVILSNLGINATCGGEMNLGW